MENLSLHYNCVALAGVNKCAELKRDGDYYYVLLAALNVFNSENIYYSYEASKHVFERSNVFMRKMLAGNLFGEEDHPPFEPGMTEAQFMDRNEWIETKNVSHHIREIDVKVTDQICNGNNVVEIWGWIKPDRERGQYLKQGLDNPHQNVCFSLRAIVRQGIIAGVKVRRIDNLITFDWVIEDGLKICNKYSSMVRGSQVAQESSKTYTDREITKQTLESIVYGRKGLSSIATESRRENIVNSAREMLKTIDSRPTFRKTGLGAARW